MFCRYVILPVDPALHVFTIIQLLDQDDTRHRQQYRRLGARPCWQPVIGHTCSVREARVHHGQLSSLHLALDDTLRLRVEIVARFQVRTDKQNKACVCMIRRWPVGAAPDLVAETRRRGADVGVAVVAVYTPRAQHALHIAVMTGSPDMVHHLVAPAFHDSGANPGGKGLQRLVPRRALPPALAALPCSFQRIENALWIVHLVDGSRAFGAISPPAPGMIGVA